MGARPRRSRGQNFLTQPAIADRIVAAAALVPEAAVLEIGPGLGILTERVLAAAVRSLVAVEIDVRLAGALSARFAADPRFTLIRSDFLDVDLKTLARGEPLIVVGNLPFNAAGAILRRLCESADAIARMVLMFQREVGERIRARPGTPSYSALSVFTAMYWELSGHFRVAAGSFHPMPRVDAEVLTFIRSRRPAFDPADEAALLRTVRAAFFSPRKTIRNALAHALKLTPAELGPTLARAGIDPAARAQALALKDFVRLARALGQRSLLNYA